MKVTWKTIAVVFLGLGLGIIIFNMIKNQKETYFKQIKLDTFNLVFNNTEHEYIDTILNVGLTELNLKNIVVTVIPLNENTKRSFQSNGELKAHIREQDGYYYIWIDELNRYENIEVLSHELIHLKQYYDKRLVLDGNTPIWLGKEYSLESVPYESRPWEIEAFSNEKELKNKIEKVLF